MPVDVGLESLDELLAGGAQLVEVLPPAEYLEEHLPGAVTAAVDEQVGAIRASMAGACLGPRGRRRYRSIRVGNSRLNARVPLTPAPAGETGISGEDRGRWY